MMRRRNVGRRMVRVAATTAVVAGTAGAVHHHQDQKYANKQAQQQAGYDQAYQQGQMDQAQQQQQMPARCNPSWPLRPRQQPISRRSSRSWRRCTTRAS